MTAPVLCLVCGGESRPLATVTNRGTVGTVFRCSKCGHKTGKLVLGPGDPPETHDYIRRKLAAMLKPAPSRRSAP